MKGLALLFAAGLTAVTVAAGCSGSSTSPGSSSTSGGAGGAQGDEDGACFPNGTCNAGLTCLANKCAIPTIDGGSSVDAASGDAGTNPDSSNDASVSDGATCPVATILHPGAETRKAGTTVPFVGKALDPSCAAIPGAKLAWVDNLEGSIGTGTNFDHVFTMLGAHTVTLTATDSNGGKVTTTISFTIN